MRHVRSPRYHAFISRMIAMVCTVFLLMPDIQAANAPSVSSAVFPTAQDPVTLLANDFVFLNRASTLGIGTEVSMSLTPKSNIRLAYDQFQDIEQRAKNKINYKLDLKVRSTSLLFDWHPFGGSFRTSIGMLINGTRLRVNAVPTETLSLDSADPSAMALVALVHGSIDPGPAIASKVTIQASNLLTARGKVSFRRVAPYLGVGWSNTAHSDRRLLYTIDLGVAFFGSPEVDLDVAGIAADLARDQAASELQAFLASEEKQLERKLKGYDVFPVLSFGLLYRF